MRARGEGYGGGAGRSCMWGGGAVLSKKAPAPLQSDKAMYAAQGHKNQMYVFLGQAFFQKGLRGAGQSPEKTRHRRQNPSPTTK